MSSRPWPFDSNGVPAAAGDPREGPTRRALDASAGRPARESPEVLSGQQITRQPSIALPRARRGPCRCFAEASSRQRRSPLRASRRRGERPASCGRQTCRVPWLPLVGVGALAQLVGGARGTRDTSQKPILARRVASVCGDTTTSAQTLAVRPLQGRPEPGTAFARSRAGATRAGCDNASLWRSSQMGAARLNGAASSSALHGALALGPRQLGQRREAHPRAAAG